MSCSPLTCLRRSVSNGTRTIVFGGTDWSVETDEGRAFVFQLSRLHGIVDRFQGITGEAYVQLTTRESVSLVGPGGM